MEGTPTGSVNKKPNTDQMYLRSCDIYANGQLWDLYQVAVPPIVENGTRANKNLEPVEMYWQSHQIYENECIAADTKNTPRATSTMVRQGPSERFLAWQRTVSGRAVLLFGNLNKTALYKLWPKPTVK